jgi:hypothetical protein
MLRNPENGPRVNRKPIPGRNTRSAALVTAAVEQRQSVISVLHSILHHRRISLTRLGRPAMTVPPCRVFDLASYRSIAIPKSAQILPIGCSRVDRAAAKRARASSDAEARDVGASRLGARANAARRNQPGVPARGNRRGSSALRYSRQAQPSIQMLAFRIARARTHRLGDMGVGIAGPPKRELRLPGTPSTHGQTRH